MVPALGVQKFGVLLGGKSGRRLQGSQNKTFWLFLGQTKHY